MKNLIIRFVRDEEGASAAEYAVLLAVIGAVLCVAAIGLSSAIGNALDGAADVINANLPSTSAG